METFLLLFCIILVIYITWIILFVYRPRCVKQKNMETFEDEASCPLLVNAVQDNEEKNVLKNKLVTVKNDGQHFRKFHDKNKTFNPDHGYCYVKTIDQSKKNSNYVPCQKDNAIYNYSMINSVTLGDVQDNDNTKPKEVCIMEINKDKVLGNDVENMSRMIAKHDNKHIMATVDECKSNVKHEIQKYNNLQKTHDDLTKKYLNLQNKFQNVTNDLETIRREKMILKAEKDTFLGRVVIIDIESKNSLSLNINSTIRSIKVPLKFNITHIFLPRNTVVRLNRKNGSSLLYTKDANKYPLVYDDVLHVEEIEVI